MPDMKTALVKAFGLEQLTAAADVKLDSVLRRARRIDWKQSRRRSRRARALAHVSITMSNGRVVRPIPTR